MVELLKEAIFLLVLIGRDKDLIVLRCFYFKLDLASDAPIEICCGFIEDYALLT